MKGSRPVGTADSAADLDQLRSAMRQVSDAHDALLQAANALTQTQSDSAGGTDAGESSVDMALSQAIFRGAGYLNALADTLATAVVRRDAVTVPADGRFDRSMTAGRSGETG